jgi:hypothetical protein
MQELRKDLHTSFWPGEVNATGQLPVTNLHLRPRLNQA